ncbi:hypothetical protein MJO28_012792 [Puccinia striiformis f. sp. tritici]|uniref:Uncharacterized protein n=4 Tax=Puccinia striiformis TaxID=27350 RepID=A0A0L0VM83_9BASI|nr:hypothetical protein Pst134EA_024711 [Puccinia striiformis f. sp. tritici]KAI9625357.1 hypothetical protein H4Q26_016381 [Puccinia striiformis f. sp. tritici PST-130]KNF00366.1 hypothetical protein PSTG_06296 [Puccinia striiformis f. sp. tritici PST-78]POV96817.1 hypothetical protein PSHT_14935 [Puccinia striiformis]KAH9445120.1 hypothetical protein Pst134EB_025369 [Puccinia striiformis f. sp. tritici]KAH9453845.1 hypothetical protein Pst134EA_024711 [Puccinia striiformis f. sp. tritici]
MNNQSAHTSPALRCQLEHKGIVHVATFNHGAQYVLTGGQDRTIRLWNAKTGNFIKDYSAHGYEILGIAVSPNNSFLGSVGGDRSVFYWDVSTGTVLRRFSGHTGVINACSFNFDGNLLISGSFDASVRIWDLKSQQRHPIQIFQDAKDSITSIIASGSEFIIGSVDGYVRSYDVRMGQMMEDYFEDPVTSIHLLKDSKTMVVSTLNSTIRLMDRERGEMLQKFTGHRAQNYRSRISMSYDEAQVLAGDEDGLLWAWDLESGKRNAGMSFDAHQKHVTWVECHPKANCFITAAADGLTKLWDLGK